MTKEEAIKALHIMIANNHLFMAGVRSMTNEEFEFAEYIAEWYQNHPSRSEETAEQKIVKAAKAYVDEYGVFLRMLHEENPEHLDPARMDLVNAVDALFGKP